MLLCKEAAQAVLEGVLAGLTLKLDDETEYCPRVLADLALTMNKTEYSPLDDEMEESSRADEERKYSTRADWKGYSPHADVEMVSPLFDSAISTMSNTGSEESDYIVYASDRDYARARQYVRRRHPSQDVRLMESASDSSFRLHSRWTICPAALDHFHHKRA